MGVTMSNVNFIQSMQIPLRLYPVRMLRAKVCLDVLVEPAEERSTWEEVYYRQEGKIPTCHPQPPILSLVLVPLGCAVVAS